MLWSLTKLVRVGELHQMNHFWADVEPSASVWQLVVWSMPVHIQPCIRNVHMLGCVEKIEMQTNSRSAAACSNFSRFEAVQSRVVYNNELVHACARRECVAIYKFRFRAATHKTRLQVVHDIRHNKISM